MQSESNIPMVEQADWPRASLGSVATKIRSGATPRGGAENYLPSRVRCVLIRSQNVLDHRFANTGLANISDDQANELSGVDVQPGDVLLNITGDGVTFGRACIVPDRVLPACVNQHVMLIRLDHSKCLPGYLLAWLTQPDTKAYIESFNAGGSRRAITKGHIESFALPIPPIEVQKWIAGMTCLLNGRIENLAMANERIEAIATNLFRSWFIDFDPVHARTDACAPPAMTEEVAALFPASFSNSVAGPIPHGWSVSRFDAICTNPRAQARPEQLPGDTAYVGLEHVPRRSLSMFERGTSAALESNKFWFEERDILFAKLRPYFHKVALAPCRGVCSTDILVLRASKPDVHAFATLHASSDEIIDYATRLSNGARMPRTSWSDLAAYPLVLPPDAVLRAFNVTASPMFNRLQGNILLARNLAEVRDSLLPRLVTGQLSIPAATHEIEEAIA